MRRFLIVAVLTLLHSQSPVAAQTEAQWQAIKVVIEIQEPSSGVLESTYKQAFRALSDVQIVTQNERSNYVLKIVAVCEDENSGSGCGSYSLAIALLTRLDSVVLGANLSSANARLPDSLRVTDDQVAALAGAFGSPLVPHTSSWYLWQTMFVARYGRDRYRTAIQEFVAQLDAQCFEKTRLIRRMADLFLADDTASAVKVSKAISAAEWICW